VRGYHPGDSDFIPEMKGLAPDVALLPVSGTYVMTAEEAVAAAAARIQRLSTRELRFLCKQPLRFKPAVQ
jgi:L-ascorbate metabolism protein UlaG (beta-lactamase superfamily)